MPRALRHGIFRVSAAKLADNVGKTSTTAASLNLRAKTGLKYLLKQVSLLIETTSTIVNATAWGRKIETFSIACYGWWI